MPLVDLVTGGANERKIVCETLVDEEEEESPENELMPDEEDYPPESFWLSKDAEYDWFDRNAFFDRKDSTKANANSISHSNQNSQRFSFTLKSKASIFGLPKTQKNTFVDSNRRTSRSVNIRLFPKRSASAGKSTVIASEPGSPKVSCIGRVRSKRRRRRSISVNRTEKPPAEKKKNNNKKKNKGGFYSKVMSVFRSKRADKNTDRSSCRKIVEATEKNSEAVEPEWRSVSYKAASEPPSLGGMKRFVSGRRSGSWASEDLNQMVSESMDLDRRVYGMSRS